MTDRLTDQFNQQTDVRIYREVTPMRSKKPADTAHFSVMIDVSEEEGMSEGVDERPG